MNYDSGFARDPCEQDLQIALAERYAAGSGRKSWAGDVEKYGAAPSGDAGSPVVVNFNNEIIEVVGAAEPISWFSGRAPERSIVAPVGRVLAPCVQWTDAARRQPRQRPQLAIRPPPYSERAKAAPSPSRLSARTPARPSATGMASGPANSQPCDRRPGRERTWRDRSDVRRMLPRFLCPAACPNEFFKCRLLFSRRMFYFARSSAAKPRRLSRGALWGSD